MKDTVQLEDLLTKPVLADPESVFSEPSFQYDRTPSVSNKSPSADSYVRPDSPLTSESETEQFHFPTRPSKKFSSKSKPSVDPHVTRDGTSMKQKKVAKNSRASSRKNVQPKLDRALAGSQRSRVGESPSKPSLQSTPVKKDISSSNLVISQEENKLSHPSSVADKRSPEKQGSFPQTHTTTAEKNQPDRSVDHPRKDESTTQENSVNTSKLVENVSGNGDVKQIEQQQNAMDSSIINQSNDTLQHNSSMLSDNGSEQELTENKNDNAKTAGEMKFNKKQAMKSPLEKLTFPEPPNLHTFIANPGSSRLRKVRQGNLRSCESGTQQSILKPGRCSFSHEAGHTANGNSKIVSPLINMSPVQERRLRSEGSASTMSSNTSPSPSASPEIFRKTEAQSDKTVILDGAKDELRRKLSSTQKSTTGKGEHDVPLQIDATVEETTQELAASDVQNNVTGPVLDDENKSPDTVNLRRSFSQHVTETDHEARNIKSFSLNLKIDFHFEGTKCVQAAHGKRTLSPSSSRNINISKDFGKKPQGDSTESGIKDFKRNVWLNLKKENNASTNNDDLADTQVDTKRNVLERSFADKSSVDDSTRNFPASRKRRSEPVGSSESFPEIPRLSGKLSPSGNRRLRAAHHSCRRAEKTRRSYASGEKISRQDGVHRAAYTTESDDAENENRPHNDGKRKRRRIQSAKHFTETHDPKSAIVRSNTSAGPGTRPLKKKTGDDNQQPKDDAEERASDIEELKNASNEIGESENTVDKVLHSRHLNKGRQETVMKNSNEGGQTLSTEISTCSDKGVHANVNKAGALTRPLNKSNSEPIILADSARLSDGAPPFDANIGRGVHEKLELYDLPSQSDSEVERTSHQQISTSKADEPKSKPKPKPRSGLMSRNSYDQPDSIEQKTAVPKIKPRMSKSIENLSHTDEGNFAGKETRSDIKFTEKGLSVSKPQSILEEETSEKESASANLEGLPQNTTPLDICDSDRSSQTTSQSVVEISAPIQGGSTLPSDDCVMRKASAKGDEKTTSVPEIEVSDDSDYDNPWDSLDGAVQRASIRYNRRPSRIAAGADTKTLLLKSAEDLGRLLEEAEKRRQLRQDVTKSTCPDGEALHYTNDGLPKTIPFTRFSPLRHTVKGLVSQPLKDASKSNTGLQRDFPSSRSSAHYKGKQPSRIEGIPHDTSLQNISSEDELVEFRGRMPKGVSPPIRPKSLSAREIAKTLTPEMTRRKY